MDETKFSPIGGEVIGAAKKAVLYRLQETSNADNEVWIPRSVVHGGFEVEKGDKDLNVAKWFVEKEGLEG